jgi:ABC-2 type transport system ATP-binding protein
LAALRRIPGVVEVREDRDAVEISASVAEPVVRQLLVQDATLSGLEVTSAGLEEAFLALTQESNKDDTQE